MKIRAIQLLLNQPVSIRIVVLLNVFARALALATAAALLTGVMASSCPGFPQSDPFFSEFPESAPDQESTTQGNTSQENEPRDTWELTAEDLMSDEELEKELFGDSVESDVTAEEETVDDPEGDDSEADPVFEKLSIESYLQNINSVTLDSSRPPAEGVDPIDAPQRLQPPRTFSLARGQIATPMYFQTPDIRHQPLYFEDSLRERGGQHECAVQPLYSGGRFLGDTLNYPRAIRDQHPRSCIHRQNMRYSNPTLLGN